MRGDFHDWPQRPCAETGAPLTTKSESRRMARPRHRGPNGPTPGSLSSAESGETSAAKQGTSDARATTCGQKTASGKHTPMPKNAATLNKNRQPWTRPQHLQPTRPILGACPDPDRGCCTCGRLSPHTDSTTRACCACAARARTVPWPTCLRSGSFQSFLMKAVSAASNAVISKLRHRVSLPTLRSLHTCQLRRINC